MSADSARKPRPWWQQATALVTVSTGGVITGLNFAPGTPATMTSPNGVPLHLMALDMASKGDLGGTPASPDAALRPAIVNIARHYLQLSQTKSPSEMEALIWGAVSRDGADHGPSCAAFASLTLELAAQAVGQHSWVTGGDTYPWPVHSWADSRVDPNPDSPAITSIQQDAQAHNRWHPAGDGYTPLPGDWVLFHQHVEVVTAYSDGVLRTIGANSAPNSSVNAHTFTGSLAGNGVAGFVDNGHLATTGATHSGGTSTSTTARRTSSRTATRTSTAAGQASAADPGGEDAPSVSASPVGPARPASAQPAVTATSQPARVADPKPTGTPQGQADVPGLMPVGEVTSVQPLTGGSGGQRAGSVQAAGQRTASQQVAGQPGGSQPRSRQAASGQPVSNRPATPRGQRSASGVQADIPGLVAPGNPTAPAGTTIASRPNPGHSKDGQGKGSQPAPPAGQTASTQPASGQSTRSRYAAPRAPKVATASQADIPGLVTPGNPAAPTSSGSGSGSGGPSSATSNGPGGTKATRSHAGKSAPAAPAAGSPAASSHHAAKPASTKPYRRNAPPPATSPPGTSPQATFIGAVAPGAMAAQQRWGVPAAVTIAQAIEESGWGQSSLAATYHNLFGIKGTGPAGSVLMPTQEFEGGQWISIDAPFRVYHNMAESISDHAELLATSGYYTRAMADRGVPDAFANDLTGVYATDPNYGSTLIGLMKLYNLYQYNTPAHPAPAPTTPAPATPAPTTTPPSHTASPAPTATQPPSATPTPSATGTPSPSSTPSATHASPSTTPMTPSATPTPPSTTPTAKTGQATIPGLVPAPGSNQGSTPSTGQAASSQAANSQAYFQGADTQAATTMAYVHAADTQAASTLAYVHAADPQGASTVAYVYADQPAHASSTAQARGVPSRPRPATTVTTGMPRSRPRAARDAAIPGYPGAQPGPGPARGSGGAPGYGPAANYGPPPGRTAAPRNGSAVYSAATMASTRPTRPAAPARPRPERIYEQELPDAVKSALFTSVRIPIARAEPMYKDIANQAGISWKLLAACDWMQCQAQPHLSPVHGERLGTLNADGTVYSTKSVALAQCASDLVALAFAVYGIDLTQPRRMSIQALADVFAAFRWGGLLRRHHVSAMEFPYSVEGLTDGHVKMRWPAIDEPNAPDRPGTKFKQPLGAVPVVLSLNYRATI